MQRNTAQKRRVLDILTQMANHPSAEAVYAAVHGAYPSISKATVYRILKDESVCGNLLAVDIPRDVNRYDHRTDPHWHIRCRRCGKVADVEIGAGSINVGTIPDGWSVERMGISFEGLCRECAGLTDGE